MANFGERDVATVKGDKHLRLLCEFTFTGFMAVVYDLGAKQPILYEMADSFEDGKRKCEECAKSYLTGTVPAITWSHQP